MRSSVHRDDGTPLEAQFGVEILEGVLTVVVESRGGARGLVGARNADYAEGFVLLLARLKKRGARILDAWVDSRATANLSIETRRLEIDGKSYPIAIDDPSDLRLRIGAAQARIGRRHGAKGSGNRTKRVRLIVSVEGVAPSAGTFEAELAGRS